MTPILKYNNTIQVGGTETPPGTSLQAIWLMGDQAYSFNTAIVPYPNQFYAIQRAVHPATYTATGTIIIITDVSIKPQTLQPVRAQFLDTPFACMVARPQLVDALDEVYILQAPLYCWPY
jgi:hypothetical protein